MSEIACPRCMPPGDPCCPYCDGRYSVFAAPPLKTPLRFEQEDGRFPPLGNIVDAEGAVLASESDPYFAIPTVFTANAFPLLVEACKAFDKWFDGWCPTGCEFCCVSGKPVADQVRAALKAAGESE